MASTTAWGIPGYHVRELIASGGMGEVFLARRQTESRQVITVGTGRLPVITDAVMIDATTDCDFSGLSSEKFRKYSGFAANHAIEMSQMGRLPGTIVTVFPVDGTTVAIPVCGTHFA